MPDATTLFVQPTAPMQAKMLNNNLKVISLLKKIIKQSTWLFSSN